MSRSDYEVAELTWSNGHLSAHGLVKPTPRYPPSVTGTLESVVDQAKLLHPTLPITPANGPHMSVAVDALVPTGRGHREDLASGIGSCDVSNTGGKRARVTGRQGSTTIGSIKTLTGVDSCGTDDFGFATTNSVTPFTTDDGIRVSGSRDTDTTSYVEGGGSRLMVVVDDHDSVCHSWRSLSQVQFSADVLYIIICRKFWLV